MVMLVDDEEDVDDEDDEDDEEDEDGAGVVVVVVGKMMFPTSPPKTSPAPKPRISSCLSSVFWLGMIIR